MTTERSSRDHYHEARRVTLIGAFLDLVLGVVKIVVGTAGKSHGLVADGVHSLSDLATDFLVILAVKYGTMDADRNHPYGHQRIQTLSTVLLGISLVVVALGIAANAIEPLVSGATLPVPDSYTLIIVLVSVFSKEWIYRYTLRASRRLKSSILEANAWHSRSDAFSSIVVLCGIAGAQFGITYLDAIAAVIVAALIVQVGGKMVWNGVLELIDTGVDQSQIAEMETAMGSVDGVLGVHQLRTRKSGDTVIADVHVTVSPNVSVSEGHRIAEEVEKSVDGQRSVPVDLTVHIDAGEERGIDRVPVPLRQQLESTVKSKWSEVTDVPLERVVIHYRAQHADVELYVAASDDTSLDSLQLILGEIRQALAASGELGRVDLFASVSQRNKENSV